MSTLSMPRIRMTICLGALFSLGLVAQAQPPGQMDPPSRTGPGADGFISRMMAFDENRDGRLTRTEITDQRLLDLFDRADSNHDGVVTKEELKALYQKESANFNRGGFRGGPGRPGRGPGRDGFREFGGPPDGAEMMRPQPGQIFSERMQGVLALTSQQRSALAEIQRDVDSKLDKLLTPAQKSQLKEIREHGPGGPRPEFDGQPRQ